MATDRQLKKNEEKQVEKSSLNCERPVLENENVLNVEKIEESKRLLLKILNEYEVMDDSFIMPADYDVEGDESKSERLNKLKLNKLRTHWFTLVFAKLNELSEFLDLNPKGLKDLRKEFDRLMQLEGSLVKEKLAGEKLDLSDPLVFIKKIKGLKKDVSSELLEDKKRLIESLDFQIKRALQMLDKLYVQEK